MSKQTKIFDIDHIGIIIKHTYQCNVTILKLGGYIRKFLKSILHFETLLFIIHCMLCVSDNSRREIHSKNQNTASVFVRTSPQTFKTQRVKTIYHAYVL